jgi:multiple sugar transport system substrate-binding protein
MVRCRGANSGLTFERDYPIETSGAGIAASFERSTVASAQPHREAKNRRRQENVRHDREDNMRRFLYAVLALAIGSIQAFAQDPVADRAVAAAKEYVKAKNLKEPKLTILLSSLYNNSFPDFAKKWEDLTGVKFEIVPLGYTDIPAKIMQEGVAKTGVYDIFNDFPYTAPDAAGAKVIIPLDDYAAKYKPDFSGIADGLKFQQYYDGKLYTMVNDGDHLLLALRKDLVENPQARAEYRAKFNKDLGCPDTMAEWAQQAAFFQTREGDTRWGIKFEKPLYGALGYRSVNFSYRHFPAYMNGLLFDKDMKPRINTPDGIAAIKAFAASVENMPKDIQGWGTPQIYPFWGSGQAYSAMSFPSIIGFGESNPNSVVKGKQMACIIPGNMVDGKLVRRAPQAAGTGYMVSAYAKHPELAYLFIQWFTSPSIGDEAVAHPKGFWDPFRQSNLTNKAILDRFGADMVKTTIENANYAASLLLIEGNYEYFKILDNNLADVMNKNITAEEAARRIEAGWNKVTSDVGRDTQVRIWRKGVELGIYLDKF